MARLKQAEAAGHVSRVLVTGGSRGIGRAICTRFAQAGYEVLRPTRSELELADPRAVREYAGSLAGVDVLVNNAAENVPNPIERFDFRDFERAVAVNQTAPFLLMSSIGARMAERGEGRIVNVSSVYSKVSRAGRSTYSTTKAALNGATRAFAVELGPRGVLVNAVCPGFVDTDLTRQNNTPSELAELCAQVPLGRLALPAEVAELVYFLGSNLNTYITGQIIAIDGGFLST